MNNTQILFALLVITFCLVSLEDINNYLKK